MELQPKQASMLEYLQRCKGNVARSVQAVGISRSTHYRWLNDFEAYAEAYNDVLEAIKDELEQALLERADDSDTVLIFLAKTRLRDRGYNERDQYTVKATSNSIELQIDLEA